MTTTATTGEVLTPSPGIYRDVSFADYLAWDCINNSRISLARRSLLHFKEQPAHEATKALRFGSFAHCGVLEPLAIAMRYAVMPRYELDAANVTKDGTASKSTGTTYYKQRAAEFAAANTGKEVVEQDAYDHLCGISRSLMRSERAREYLCERGDVEVCFVWDDEETGLRCKCRVDMLNSGICDLKTCLDAQAFPKSIAAYGYHRQGAHYQAGVAALTGEVKPFRIVAVEKTAPYGVRSAPLNEDAIETGAAEVRQAMRAIAGAYESGVWPCYTDPASWCLPSWYGGSDEIELIINGETVSI